MHVMCNVCRVYSRHLVINVQAFLCSVICSLSMHGDARFGRLVNSKTRLPEEVCSTGFHLKSSPFKKPPLDFKPDYLIHLRSYLCCCFKPGLASS